MSRAFKLGLLALVTLHISHRAHADPAKPESTELRFYDVSTLAGLVSPPTWKYGGPCVADINGDGRYDLVLGNHDRTPIQFFLATGSGTYEAQPDILYREDIHGIAPGDYDLDGDLDLLVSLGGGNGTNPKPPRLLRNDGDHFTDVTEEAGIAQLGARGRTVRWIDLNTDRYLDVVQINAAQMESETGPRNVIFKNLGDGTFEYVPNPAFEAIEADKALVTDIDQDHIPDLLTFSPWSRMLVLRGGNDFSFTDVTDRYLPEHLRDLTHVQAVAEADIDNDGDMDYYLARGMSGFQLANNSVSLDPQRGRMDLRDEGGKGHDGITFYADHGIDLVDFHHFPRGPNQVTLPVFLGEAKTRIQTPVAVKWIAPQMAAGFPQDLDQSGWYLGCLGEGKWRLEWMLLDNLAWHIEASVINVRAIEPDWTPLDPNVPDVLLRNDGQTFTDISEGLPPEGKSNNQGVATADFDNDGAMDFFVFRFGELSKRIPDVLMINRADGTFSSTLDHGATDLNEKAHGDMGSAFDFDLDGDADILSGDDDNGTWHQYQNMLIEASGDDQAVNHMLVRVGYADTGVDPVGAVIQVTTGNRAQTRRVGSGSAAFSQSLLNTAHFGLGNRRTVTRVHVRWRDGSEAEQSDEAANQLIRFGRMTP